MSKFKIGDLVELSAAGEKNKANFLCRSGYGMVIKLLGGGSQYPIVCHWPTKGSRSSRRDKEHRFKEYELKRLKVKK